MARKRATIIVLDSAGIGYLPGALTEGIVLPSVIRMVAMLSK